ncbi:MAG TPA: aspartate aminotransferase family protein [Clostridia bacterium]|jgi:acetylornithine/N-succinyldiaminopimelate aminotransferase
MKDLEQIKKIDSQYYMSVFNRFDVCFERGQGCKLYDIDGKEYIDFSAGIAVNCLGHNDEELVEAITEQAKKAIHISNLFYSPVQAECAQELLKDSDFDKVFFCNSGAEANEGAIKLARKYFYSKGLNKPAIITAKNSFHGRTLTTAAATGQEKYSKPYAPLPEKFIYVPYNDFEALENAISDEVAAVMLEVIQAEGGIIAADYDYIRKVEKICKQKGLLLIIDEVQTGMGRTGKMFAYQHYDIKPDIITLAKGLGGGVPIGAVLARGECANAFVPGDHGSTFGGNPLACSAAMVVLKRLKSGLIDSVKEVGDYFYNKLLGLKKYPAVKDVRGKGLLLAVELDQKINSRDVIDKLRDNCYIVIGCGKNTLRFCPPLIIEKEHIDGMVECLEVILKEVN